MLSAEAIISADVHMLDLSIAILERYVTVAGPWATETLLSEAQLAYREWRNSKMESSSLLIFLALFPRTASVRFLVMRTKEYDEHCQVTWCGYSCIRKPDNALLTKLL